MKLDKSLSIGEAAGDLGDLSGRKQEDLGLDVFRADLAVLHLRRGVPEGRALDFEIIFDHQPVQLAERLALQAGVQ